MQPIILFSTGSPVELFTQIFPVVNDVVHNVVIPKATERDKERTGGWATVWRKDPESHLVAPVLGFAVGAVSVERFLKYQHFATEKANRIAHRPGDISSWQSRDTSDPDHLKCKYGGAIRCITSGVILSFSGFSEHEDELICLVTAWRLGLMSDEFVEQIATASQNEAFYAYRDSRGGNITNL